MALVDKCIFNSSTSGTASFNVDTAVQGYLTPAQSGAVDARTYSYSAQLFDAAGNIQQWEVGSSTASNTATRFSRTVEFGSSGNGITVNFVSAPLVTLTALQADFIQTVVSDTNVTGALSPATLTLGWTGLLGLNRGGSAADLSATGGSKQYVRQSTLGGPFTVGVIPGSDITGAALTKTDDTNVTLTLGGSPSTALLNATSITVGWSGTLALSRLAQGTDGQLIVGQTSASPLYKTITGDWTLSAAGVATLATVNSNVGIFGSSTAIPVVTVNGKGLITAITTAGLPGSFTGFANPTASVGLSAVNGSATTAMRSDAAPPLSQSISPTMTGNWTFIPTSGNAITINPASGTLAKAINSIQVGPNTGTSAGPIEYNTIAISDGSSPTGTLFTKGVQLNMDILSNATGNKSVLNVEMTHTVATATGGDFIAILSRATSRANNGGTSLSPIGNLFGANPQAIAFSGATFNAEISGIEADVRVDSGASTVNRFGISTVNLGSQQGSGLDAAFKVGSTQIGGSFQNVIVLDPKHGAAPLDAAGYIVRSGEVSGTLGGVIDLHQYTFSGNIFNFGSPFSLTGAGALSAAVSLTSPIHYGGSAAGSVLTLQSTSNGSPSADTVLIKQGGLTRVTFQTLTSTVFGLELNFNAVAPPSIPTSGARLSMLDGTGGGWVAQTYGASPQNVFIASQGTNATPTQVTLNMNIGRLLYRGYDGSGVYSANQAAIDIAAAEAWTGATNRGTRFALSLTPIGSATNTNVLNVFGSGGMSIGNNNDPGAGLIYTNSASFLLRTKTSLTNGAGVGLGTITTAPTAGNPTKWLPYDDNGTTRYIPAW